MARLATVSVQSKPCPLVSLRAKDADDYQDGCAPSLVGAGDARCDYPTWLTCDVQRALDVTRRIHLRGIGLL